MCFKMGDVKHGLGLQGGIAAGLDARERRRWRKSKLGCEVWGLWLLQVQMSFGYLPGIGWEPRMVEA